MPDGVQSAKVPVTPLNMDFGHAPLGKLDKRKVQIGETTPPRATTPTEKVKGLFGRSVNALPPGSDRMDVMFRQELGQLSSKMSTTLGKIATIDTSTPAGKQEVQAALQELRQFGMAMSDYYEVDYQAMIEAQFQTKLNRMNPEERRLVQEGLSKAAQNGIDLQGMRVLSGHLTAKAQAMAEVPLKDLRSTTGLRQHMWSDGTPSGISENLYKAMTTSPMFLDGVLLVDGVLDGNIPDDKMKQAVAKLREFAGDNIMLYEISANTHEGLLSGLETAQISEDSPLMLPDGTPGALRGPKTTSYEFTTGENGSIKLHVTQKVEGRVFHPFGESPQRLDPNQSKATFEMDVVFPRNSIPKMAGPVKFEYQAKLDTSWNNPAFLRPFDLQDIMDRRGEPALQTAFENLCRSQFMPENLEFLRAYQDIPDNISHQEAQQMVDRYFSDPEAPTFINISRAETDRVLEGFRNMTPQTFTAQAFRELLHSSMAEVHGMVENGPFKRFIASNVT